MNLKSAWPNGSVIRGFGDGEPLRALGPGIMLADVHPSEPWGFDPVRGTLTVTKEQFHQLFEASAEAMRGFDPIDGTGIDEKIWLDAVTEIFGERVRDEMIDYCGPPAVRRTVKILVEPRRLETCTCCRVVTKQRHAQSGEPRCAQHLRWPPSE
jgi:hypothetical protein